MIVKTTRLLGMLLGAALLLGALPASTEIDKFGWVTDRVAAGGQPTVPQIGSLAREGFRAIINLREPSEYDAAAEAAAAKEHGLLYFNIPVKTVDPRAEQVEAFLKTTANPRIYPAYIHCGTGNRVAAFWMIRRVLVDKWEIDDAQREAKVVGLKSESLKEFALGYIRSHAAAR